MIKIGGGCRQVLNAHTYYYGYFNVCSMVCGVVIKSANCRTIAFFYPSFFCLCNFKVEYFMQILYILNEIVTFAKI